MKYSEFLFFQSRFLRNLLKIKDANFEVSFKCTKTKEGMFHSYHLIIQVLKGWKTDVCQKNSVANYELLPLKSRRVKFHVFTLHYWSCCLACRIQICLTFTTFLVRTLNKKSICNYFQLNHKEKNIFQSRFLANSLKKVNED